MPELAWSDIPWSDPRWLDLRPLMYNAAENAEVRMGRHYTLLTIIILKHTLTTWSPLQVFAMNMWKKFQSWKVVGFSNLPQFLQVMIDGYLTVCKILYLHTLFRAFLTHSFDNAEIA